MYKIIFKNPFKRSFNKLNKILQKQIIKKIKSLKDNPKLGKPLVGNLRGLWSLRIDKYRVLYQIEEKELILFILDVGHRKNIY